MHAINWWNHRMYNVHAQPTQYRSKTNRKQTKTKSHPITSPDIHLHEDVRIQVGKSDTAEARYSCRTFHYSTHWACQTCRGTSTPGSPTKTSLGPKCTVWFRSQIPSIMLWDVCVDISSKHPTAVEMQVVVLVRGNKKKLAMRWQWQDWTLLEPICQRLARLPRQSLHLLWKRSSAPTCANELNQCAAKQWGELTWHVH